MLFWSQKFREMLDYESQQDFPDVLESWSDLLNPEDKERVLNHYWDVVNDRSGQKTYKVEYHLETQNQGERWFRAIGRLTRREDGSPIKFYGVFLDVDEEIRARQNEEAKTTNLVAALSSVYTVVVLVDMKASADRLRWTVSVRACTADTFRKDELLRRDQSDSGFGEKNI